jgi:hypothetical protein
VSRTVDLFISSTAPVDELAAVIAARTGRSHPGPVDGPGGAGEVELREGDLSAVLRPNTYLDDGDLVLRPYRYVLSTRTTASGHLGLSPETAWLRRVAAALDDHQVLLVLDLQYRDEARGESR